MHRVPTLSLSALLAAPHPEIDLRLQAYTTSTTNFLAAVASYKSRAIATLTAQRTAHAADHKRLLDKTNAVSTETNACKLREIELVSELESEKEERKGAELEVAALKRQLASLREKCQTIEGEIEQYRAITDNLSRERATERTTLRTHAARVSPQVSALEQTLGCIIEGMPDQQDRLLLRFAHIAPDRECSLVLDIAQGYKVVTASPPLPALSLLVNTLNETRRLYDFIQDVRMAYQTHLQPAS